MSASAEFLLASTIQTAYRAKQESHSGSKLYTGCRSFDDALVGSLSCDRYGLTCISGDEQVVSDVSCSLLISHLLAPRSTVTIIDSRGNLDLARLATTIKARLIEQPELYQAGRTEGDDNAGFEIEARAMEVLDRIKIIRVFDYEGAVEALQEVQSELEAGGTSLQGSPEVNDVVGQSEANRQSAGRVMETKFPGTIPDSQAEEGVEIVTKSAESAGLDDSPDLHAHLDDQDLRHCDPHPQHGSSIPTTPTTPTTPSPPASAGRDLLILDNLTSLITPIQRENFAHAQALLSNFLRSLRHLHTLHGTSTLLLNGVVRSSSSAQPSPFPSRVPPARSSYPDARDPLDKTIYSGVPESIFASTRIKSALSRGVLPESVDLSMLIHPVPRSEDDARSFAAREAETGGQRRSGAGEGYSRNVRFVNVVEVLCDRRGAGTGRFGAFEVGFDGCLRDAFR